MSFWKGSGRLSALLSTRAARLFVLGLFCIVMLMALASTREISGTEVFYARLSKWMAESGDFAAPYRGERAYLLKPPLVMWCTAVFIRMLGPTSLAASLASRLFGLGAVFLTFVAAKRLYGAATAWFAALILVTNSTFGQFTTTFRMDSGLLFGIMLSLTGYLYGRRWWGPAVFYLGIAVGLLSKGPLGLAPLVLVSIHALAAGTLAKPWEKRGLRWLAWVPVLLPAVLWYGFLITEHGGRFFTELATDAAAGHPASAWVFVVEMFEAVIWKPFMRYWPFIPFMVAGLWMAARQLFGNAASRRSRARAALVLIWFAVNVAAAAAMPYHNIRYLYTAIPPLAFVGGRAVIWLSRGRVPPWMVGLVAGLTIFATTVLTCFLGTVCPSTRPTVEMMKRVLDQEVGPRPALVIGTEPPDPTLPIRQDKEFDWCAYYLGRTALRIIHFEEATRDDVLGEPVVLVNARIKRRVLERLGLRPITGTKVMLVARPILSPPPPGER